MARRRGQLLIAPELIDPKATAGDPPPAPGRHLDAHQPLLAWWWELRHNVTVYDAAYVALAELLEVELVTADGHLASAPGLRCRVELLC